MNNDQYEQAKKIVKKKKKFYHHLKSYVIVNAVFLIFMFLEDDIFSWLPVTLFWGMGLLFQYINTFGVPGSKILSEEWESEEVDREYRRLSSGRRRSERLELKEIRPSYRESDLV